MNNIFFKKNTLQSIFSNQAKTRAKHVNIDVRSKKNPDKERIHRPFHTYELFPV